MNKYIPLLSALILTLFLAGGCVSEQQIPAVEPTPTETDVELSINIRSADNPLSRADYELEKTPEECKITSVTVFIVPLTGTSGNYVEDWTNAQYRMVFYPELVGTYYNLTFTLKSATGLKHIYAAANMSHAQTLAFMDRSGAYYSQQLTYPDITAEFADPSATGKGIVMIAQLEVGGSPVIDLSGSGTRTITTDHADLTRVVSKVLMICKTDDSGDYGITGVTTLFHAFVGLENVYFALNPTGKVLFRDENKALDSFFGIRTTPPYRSEEWMKALKYDADRIGQTNAAGNHYVEGLYCLANKVSTNSGITSTQLTVRAKYLPQELVTGYDGTGRVITPYANAADVEAALIQPGGQVDTAGDPITYPAGTYWKLGDHFYTYAGMMATISGAPVIEGVKREAFLPYLGAIGYYVVDIDPSKDLERNNYYILTVTDFGVPVHTLEEVDGGEMQINSLKIEWVPKGTQTVIVKPE